MTHECFSENVLLIPRISQQLVASENQKSVQNSRHIGRVAHDSNKIARNRLDTSQIKLQRRGTRYFCFALIYFHYHTVRTKLTAQSSHRPHATTCFRACSVCKRNVEPRVLHVFSNGQVRISYGLKLSVFGFACRRILKFYLRLHTKPNRIHLKSKYFDNNNNIDNN